MVLELRSLEHRNLFSTFGYHGNIITDLSKSHHKVLYLLLSYLKKTLKLQFHCEFFRR